MRVPIASDFFAGVERSMRLQGCSLLLSFAAILAIQQAAAFTIHNPRQPGNHKHEADDDDDTATTTTTTTTEIGARSVDESRVDPVQGVTLQILLLAPKFRPTMWRSCYGRRDGGSTSKHWNRSIVAEEEFEDQYYARLNKKSQRTSDQKHQRKIIQHQSSGTRGRTSKRRVPHQRMRQAKRQAERQEKEDSLAEVCLPFWRRKSNATPSESSSTSVSTFQSGTSTTSAKSKHRQRRNNNRRQTPPANQLGAAMGLPSAQEMGLSAPMYDRLLQIASGDEITPEDYELLTLLDEKNARKTMQDTSELEVLVVSGDCNGEDEEKKQECAGHSNWLSQHGLTQDSCCLICLQSFGDLEEGTKLCRLPCQHVFCHSCVEFWLRERSTKCPDLSCFWQATTIADNDRKTEENESLLADY